MSIRQIQWIEIFAENDPPWVAVHLTNNKLDFYGEEGPALLRALGAVKAETESDAKITEELLESIQMPNQSK